MVNRNSERSLDGLFTIQAWHAKFDEETREADLHVHVNFNKAEMGGDETAKISFELLLRRATIVAMVPDSDEGFEVDPTSIFRASPKIIESKEMKSDLTEKAGEVGAEVSLSQLKSTLSGEYSSKHSHEQSTSINATVNSIIMRDGMTSEGEYCWHLTPHNGTVLDGTPWEVKTQPLLNLVDNRDEKRRVLDIKNNMTTPVYIQVRCRRVDLEINLEPKDKTLKEKLMMQTPGERDKRIAAAESFIRDELANQGLFHESDLSENNKYYKITLANIVAHEKSLAR